MSVTVSDAAQNISGEFTHPIDRTKSMHRRVDVSVGWEGTMYVKGPMSDGRRRHRWKASEISHFKSHAGPPERSAS